MKKIFLGSIAIVIVLVGFSVFFPAFLTFLAGIIPLLLIIGGGLTIYINYDSSSSDCNDSQNCQNGSQNIICNSNIPVSDKSKHKEPIVDSAKKINPNNCNPEKGTINESKDADNRLIGNTESLVFHNADCKFSKSKNCTVLFDTREKAIQEGYKPCGICKP